MVWLSVLPSGPPNTSPAHTAQELRMASRPEKDGEPNAVIGPVMRSALLGKTAKGMYPDPEALRQSGQ